MRLEILPVAGLPEIGPGDDLAEQICAHASLSDGDVLVVAQKIVSKAEGRTAPVAERDRAIADGSVEVLARRDDLVIVRTTHGFVCANAGVDTSNVEPGTITLLPLDPDGSAERIRRGIAARTGAAVGVIVSDTFGRPWRVGQTNVALGVAGIRPLRDHRGEKDTFGTLLEATLIAVADEIAGAAELVMGKSDGVPVAIVRGAEGISGEGSARELIRPVAEDLFPAGGVEIAGIRRVATRFTAEPVADEVVERAVRAAAGTVGPRRTGGSTARAWRFVWLRSSRARRTVAGESLLRDAPVVIACRMTDGPDLVMRAAEAGGALQRLMVALAAQGVGSCWIPVGRPSEDGWTDLGYITAGYAVAESTPGEDDGDELPLDIR